MQYTAVGFRWPIMCSSNYIARFLVNDVWGVEMPFFVFSPRGLPNSHRCCCLFLQLTTSSSVCCDLFYYNECGVLGRKNISSVSVPLPTTTEARRGGLKYFTTGGLGRGRGCTNACHRFAQCRLSPMPVVEAADSAQWR